MHGQIISQWGLDTILILNIINVMKMKHPILLILILLLVSSCEKMQPGDCFKNTGEITEESRETIAFKYLHMYNNVDVYIKYDPNYSISVRAGKNVIPGIKTSISDQTITIENVNSCNWVRSFDKPIEVYIGTPDLDSIVYQSSGNLSFTNQFVGDSIKIDVLEGAGSINLWLEMIKSTFNLAYGTANLNVRGYTHLSYLHSEAYGPADLSALNTEFTFMTNKSTNNCRVKANLELNVGIYNVGDVYYSGNPLTVKADITGTGRLIKE